MLSEIIIILAFLTRSLRNILYHLFWWEKKEYRFDRMLVHLRETYQGRKWLFGPFSAIKWVLLIFSFVNGVIYLIYAVFIVEAIKNIFELKIGWRIPPLKSRVRVVFLITVLSLFFIVLHIVNRGLNIAVTLLIADKLLGPLTALFIFISNLIFTLYKKMKITKAAQKIQQANQLKIIGVTGSYGKTTTKELIVQILSQKYKVLKTLGSQNTDIGIAELILATDLGKYEFFVCEMAAYKKGEIAAICQMLKPRIEIGVVTGINEQHQSLFGSLENTKRAKFELIEALKPAGLTVFNGRSKYIEEMVKWTKKRNLKTIIVDKVPIKKLPPGFHGEHFQENLQLSITVASAVGMSDSEIETAIEGVQLPAQTMNIIKKGKIILIDDTFNANPDGVYSALEYLKIFKGKKIFVLQPLIELGKYAQEVHQRIGKIAAQICDEIILTNKNFNSFFLEGVKTVKGGIKKVEIGKPLPQILEGVVLFEGKEAKKYLYHFR